MMTIKVTISTFIFTASIGTAFAQSPLLPGKLAIYYGFPSLVNGSVGDLDAATDVFNDHDVVVFGDGLQDPAHLDHANTETIISNLGTLPNNTAVYGYIPIGVTSVNLALAEIQGRVDDWDAMGVAGIFLDEAGFDFGVSRQRQSAAVDYVHSKGLGAFINAFDPDDVFSPAIHPTFNPTGMVTSLGPNDIYLNESFQIILNGFQDPAFWASKSDAASTYKDQFGTQMATVTTVSAGDPAFNQAKSDYAWWSTLLYGFDMMGWGELFFSAADNSLPFRARPEPGEIGGSFTSVVNHAGDPLHSRTTASGTIEVDVAAHTGRFLHQSQAALYVWRDPEPSRNGTPVDLVEAQRLAEFALAEGIGTIYYDNFGCGALSPPGCPAGAQEQGAATLSPIVSLLHSRGLRVEALYTDNTRITDVLTYNNGEPAAARFDAIRLDIEAFPSGASEPTTSIDLDVYADAVDEAGDLPVYASISHHWDTQISYPLAADPAREAYKQILDIVAGVDVQTAQDNLSGDPIVIEKISKEEVCYANSLSKRVHVTAETYDVVTQLGLSDFNTFFEEGEAAMKTALANIDYTAPGVSAPCEDPIAGGFAYHFYRQSYGSPNLAGWETNIVAGLVFRLERATGNVFANSFIGMGADLAERIDVSEPVEPGDVVGLDANRPGHYRKARGSSRLVAGVISTEPGFILGNNDDEKQSEIQPMLALMGRVPVKATTENGPIRPGDLLTISRKPGYAMRCDETKECVIIGKALEVLEEGEGKILVLVMAY